MAEGAEADEAFAGGAEATSGRSHHVALVQNQVEHVPAFPAGELRPHVGAVSRKVHFHARRLEIRALKRLLDARAVRKVVVHARLHVGKPLLRKRGKPARLRHVRRAVEERGHNAVPVLVDRGAVGVFQLVRHDRPAEAHACKARGLGERVYLDGAGLCARNLENRLGERRVADKGEVRRVEDDDAAVFVRKVHEAGKLLARGGGARGVVRRAEVDERVRLNRAQIGEKVVLRRARQVGHAFIAGAVRLCGACRAHDHRAVHVDRVGRILHRHLHVASEERLDARDVAFRAVGDEHLACVRHALVEHLGNLLAQGGVSLLVAVARVAFFCGKSIRVVGHRPGDMRRKRLGRVSDTEADDGCVRVGCCIFAAAAGDFREKVARGQVG